MSAYMCCQMLNNIDFLDVYELIKVHVSRKEILWESHIGINPEGLGRISQYFDQGEWSM